MTEFLRPARNAQEAVQRVELIERAAHQCAEIEQYFADIAHWNQVNPNEQPIDADPDGSMGRCLAFLKRFAKETNG